MFFMAENFLASTSQDRHYNRFPLLDLVITPGERTQHRARRIGGQNQQKIPAAFQFRQEHPASIDGGHLGVSQVTATLNGAQI